MRTTCSLHERDNKCVQILVPKSERNRQIGRTRRRCVDNTNLYLKQIGCQNVGWIRLVQGMVRWWDVFSGVINLRVP
jgi:hypothetical protein